MGFIRVLTLSYPILPHPTPSYTVSYCHPNLVLHWVLLQFCPVLPCPTTSNHILTLSYLILPYPTLHSMSSPTGLRTKGVQSQGTSPEPPWDQSVGHGTSPTGLGTEGVQSLGARDQSQTPWVQRESQGLVLGLPGPLCPTWSGPPRGTSGGLDWSRAPWDWSHGLPLDPRGSGPEVVIVLPQRVIADN